MTVQELSLYDQVNILAYFYWVFKIMITHRLLTMTNINVSGIGLVENVYIIFLKQKLFCPGAVYHIDLYSMRWVPL